MINQETENNKTMNEKPLGFGELCPRLNPVPEGAQRLKFKRGGVNVTRGPNEGWHMFRWSDGSSLILRGWDVNRIGDYVDVWKYTINGAVVYSDLTEGWCKTIISDYNAMKR